MNKMQGVTPSEEVKEKIFNLIANTSVKRPTSTIKEKRKVLETCTVNEIAEKGDTYYGLFNGVTNYLTHHAKHEASNDEVLTYNIAGAGAKISSKALNMIVNDMRERGCLN